MDCGERTRRPGMHTAKCIGIGLALGIVCGVVLHSYALGIIIGVAVGVVLCLVWRRRQRP
jgi:hypothetical protein